MSTKALREALMCAPDGIQRAAISEVEEVESFARFIVRKRDRMLNDPDAMRALDQWITSEDLALLESITKGSA